MSAPNPLFRQEALESRRRGEGATAADVRLGRPWLWWSYRLVLVLVAAGVIAAVVVRTDVTTSGAAVVDARGGTFKALIPAAVASQLATAEVARVEVPGRSRAIRVDVLRARLAGERQIERAGLPTASGPALVLSGTIPAGAGLGGRPMARRTAARMTVVLRTERLGDALVRRLGAMLGGGNGA